ncbi:MAG: hypothetical protein KGQ38_03145 [Actinomycetales bacterium]|nr:hypothetical protein [Actinomycetales bacterium]
MAQVLKVLAEKYEVSIVFPSNDPVEVPHYISGSLILPKQGDRANTFSVRPKLGADILAIYEQELSDFISQRNPDFIYWSHSYLPAGVPDLFEKLASRSLVEFANIEGQRFASMAKVARTKPKIKLLLESVKAKVWEPKVARQAFKCVALSSNDANQLAQWEADVLLAPNGVDYAPLESAGQDGYLLIFASMNYAPNVSATLSFVSDYWPKISELYPNLELVIAGRSAANLNLGHMQNIRIISDPVSQDDVYQGAIATVIPTQSGGGSQLKITESLQRNRLCLISPYTLGTAPAELVDYLSEFVFHDSKSLLELVGRLSDASNRYLTESEIEHGLTELSWRKTMNPVLHELER